MRFFDVLKDFHTGLSFVCACSYVTQGNRNITTPDEEIAGLIPRARAGETVALGRLLDLHRDYLRGLAVQQLAPKLKGRLDGSDIVQQTCLSVHKQFENWTLPQIGEHLNLTLDAVVWLMKRSMKHLKEHLKDE